MSPQQVFQGDWTWTGESFESDVQIAVDERGKIMDVGPLGLKPTMRFPRHALLPGFVNTHSHAFQRGLRGKGESFPEGAGSFWTWREAMYRLVQEIDSDAFYRLCLQTFREMRTAGITTVGEFHYFHHSGDASDYAFDELALRAAAAVGIRIVLLNAFYKTGGIGQPLSAPQQRFRTESPEAYWEHLDSLRDKLDSNTQTLGTVVHSIRAAKPDDIAALHLESVKRSLPFHIHVEEQRKEIEDSITSYGKPPMALLHGVLSGCANVTAIHCTHTDPHDMERFLDAGGRVCLCPLTEANLGDGIPALPGRHAIEGRIALGTDSNARICMTEEMRWLEYGQRLANQARGVHTDARGRSAPALLRIATENGAASLGIEAGRLVPGTFADFVAVDLANPSLRGCDETTLLESFIFGSGNDAIAGTCVGGKWEEVRGETSEVRSEK